jgi:hypothetical protein
VHDADAAGAARLALDQLRASSPDGDPGLGAGGA